VGLYRVLWGLRRLSMGVSLSGSVGSLCQALWGLSVGLHGGLSVGLCGVSLGLHEVSLGLCGGLSTGLRGLSL